MLEYHLGYYSLSLFNFPIGMLNSTNVIKAVY